MIGCTKRAWEDQRGGSGRDYTYPPTFERDHEELEDERRLFYVAMTRAERTLRISFHEGDRQNPGPTQMIDELAERMALPVHEAELPAATQAMAQASGIALQTQEAASDAERPDYKQLAAYLYSTLAPAAPAAEQLNETPLDPALLEHYALSATGLNTYLACKRKFYYEELLRIPQLQDPNMALGAAVHRSLQDFFTQMQQEAGELPPLATLQQRYREHLARFRGLLSPHQYESFRAWAEQILPGYYATFQEAWRRNVRNEYRIADVAIGSAPVVGRIDKVEFDWDGLHLVDYKAGNPDNGRPQMQRPNEKNPMGRDYWRQLMFYVLLARQDPSLELPVKSAYLEYVPPDRNGQYQRFFLKYDEQELQDMAELIETTDRMIRQEQRFEKLTPAERQAESYDPCAQCRFFSVCWGEAAIV
jgi:DNA helicase-2/ATP-dependent DNA helicase PcrA